jgi:Uma2 family endonuclease
MPEERLGGEAMAVRDPARRKLTYDDYVLIPEDGLRHEILDGEHFVSPAPRPRHQVVAASLNRMLDRFVYENRLGQVLFAPLDFVFDKHNVAQPDLVFISNERSGLIGEAYVSGAPDLVVEILSPSTRRTDELIKRSIYERFGALEYWLVDPDRRTVQVFRRASTGFGPVQVFSAEAGESLTTPLLPGLVIQVGEIFE